MKATSFTQKKKKFEPVVAPIVYAYLLKYEHNINKLLHASKGVVYIILNRVVLLSVFACHRPLTK